MTDARRRGQFLRSGSAILTALLAHSGTLAAGADEVLGRLPRRPPGPHFALSEAAHKDAPTFRAGKPVVGTTYFYWYDAATKAHILNGDGSDALTNHPADMAGISYKSEGWHETQMSDMVDAGLDFLMPVYWGVPGQYGKGAASWSFDGLPPLVAAHDALLAKGRRPPAIGLFYDTSILRHNSFNADGSRLHVDLTTDGGKAFFYTAIRDFFSLIPPKKWARVDGRPIVFLYAAAFARKQDPAAMAYARRRFREDFGVDPYIVKHVDWEGEADASYGWGGAVSPRVNRHVAAIGPGYDHSAVPGRTPLIVERRDGKTYAERWERLLALDPARRPWMIHVETWNEWHEGTDVAESKEYGRAYIDMTKRYADLWRKGERRSLPGAYSKQDHVRWRPGAPEGLEIRPPSGDGEWEAIEIAGARAVTMRSNDITPARYLYFLVDDSFIYDGADDADVEIRVTFLDKGLESFLVEYDNLDMANGEGEGAFRDSPSVAITGTGKWRTATVRLPEARFVDRCNQADLRLTPAGDNLVVREMMVWKKPRQ